MAAHAVLPLLAGLMLTGLMLAGCAPDLGPEQKPHQYKLRSGPLPVAEFRADWFDPARGRVIPVKVYQPVASQAAEAQTAVSQTAVSQTAVSQTAVSQTAGTGRYPLILFSHSLGSQRDDFAYLGRHWASHGYVVIHPTHFGTDLSALFQPAGLVQSVVSAITDCTTRLDRVLDIRFVLDYAAGLPELAELIDFERVGVAGHSFGAHTALTLAGMRVNFCDGPRTDLRDPRIRAIVAISPQGEGVLGLEAASWEQIESPTLHIYGQFDVDFIVVLDPGVRRTAFDRSRGPDQYLVQVAAALHVSFSDYSLVLPYNKVNLLAQDATRMATAAFFDAYLKQDPAGRDWLASGSITAATAGMCTIERKNFVPEN